MLWKVNFGNCYSDALALNSFIRAQKTLEMNVGNASNPSENGDCKNTPPPDCMTSHFRAQSSKEEQERQFDSPKARVEKYNKGNKHAEEDSIFLDKVKVRPLPSRCDSILLV